MTDSKACALHERLQTLESRMNSQAEALRALITVQESVGAQFVAVSEALGQIMNIVAAMATGGWQ